MSNTKNGQTTFPLQASPNSTYRVGPGMLFSTIQSAINQAAADGFISNDTPAYVVIYPGVYTENVSLKPGISLVNSFGNSPGMLNPNGTGGDVVINGNMDYTNSNALNVAQNNVTIYGINITCLNGVTLLIAGTAPSRIDFFNTNLQKQTGGDVNPVFRFTNSGTGSQVVFNDGSQIISNVGASTVLDLQQGITTFRERGSNITTQNGSSFTSLANVQNTAQLSVFNAQQWSNSLSATQLVLISSATAKVTMVNTWLINTLSGGHGIQYDAAGFASFDFCRLGVNASTTSYIAHGAAGQFQYGGCVFPGTNVQVQSTLTIETDLSVVVPTP